MTRTQKAIHLAKELKTALAAINAANILGKDYEIDPFDLDCILEQLEDYQFALNEHYNSGQADIDADIMAQESAHEFRGER